MTWAECFQRLKKQTLGEMFDSLLGTATRFATGAALIAAVVGVGAAVINRIFGKGPP